MDKGRPKDERQRPNVKYGLNTSSASFSTQLDLFWTSPSTRAAGILEGRTWPSQDQFPTNRNRTHVRDVVWDDLVSSPSPLLIAGYSSIGKLIELIAAWDDENHDPGQVRLVLGAEPFTTNRHAFRSDRKEFTDEARHYWLEERGVSLRLSAKVLQAIDALERGAVHARFVHGATRLHAKIYVGVNAATVGSSNFTDNGLSQQFEANARFETPKERRRYRELASVAENYWVAGEPWEDELRALLEDLLQKVTWQEALARACSELLTGAWAARYINGATVADQSLWPSQCTGIAQALWIMESVGSVLVADATGSGKTRMGAHLVRAARDRLWSTGRVRRDLTVLVGPPAVVGIWEKESLGIGLMISPVSHGLLSHAGRKDHGREELAVRGAQILAVDEAHNFLNASSNRTQQVRESLADNIMLFTATPISRGASDLLNLVGLLGPDNFEDATLNILNRLERRHGFGGILSEDELGILRKEIQRFTVRRTKVQINEMVLQDESAYFDSASGRVCRYPVHEAHVYPTGESTQDEEIANRIRPVVDSLVGLAQLERRVAVPKGLRRIYTDDEWLRFRLRSANGLARHHVLEALRSSRAALIEHVAGTGFAAGQFAIDARFKPTDTGDVLAKLDRLAEEGPPQIELKCEIDPWLVDPDLWASYCVTERSKYEVIGQEVNALSPAREQAKVALLAARFAEKGLILAFDHHPITLSVLESMLVAEGVDSTEVMVATSSKSQRDKVIRRFALGGEGRAIALCSDAMNEGLNLQRASCIVHLDLPTTLRVAEQRVGRIERMNSPFDAIESWWPEDGPAFATRAYEKLVRRARESEDLLGSNLQLPDFQHADGISEIVTTASQIEELETSAPAPWDGIQDALEPVRQLVFGSNALVDPDTYASYSNSRDRVISRVSPVVSSHPWAFFAVAAIAHGAPRWILVEGTQCLTDLNEIAERLRVLLDDDPPSRDLDQVALDALNGFLDAATAAERRLLPRRMLRALDQMSLVMKAWAAKARRAGDEKLASEWLVLEALASTTEPKVDPYRVAECWLNLVAPEFEKYREEKRRARYILLRHLQPQLVEHPMVYEAVVETFSDLPIATPLEERVTACIIGVPEVSKGA